MSQKMTPIEIIGLKTDLAEFLTLLGDLGCVHIDRIDESRDVLARPLTLEPAALQRQEALNQVLTGLTSLLDVFAPFAPRAAPCEDKRLPDLAGPQAALAEITPQVQELTRRQELLLGEQNTLPLYEATLRKLLPLIPAAAYEPGNLVVGVMVNRANMAVLDQIGRQVMTLTQGQATIAGSDIDETTRAMLMVLPNEYERDIERLVGEKDVSRLRLPLELGAGLPAQVLENLHRRQREIPTELQDVNEKLRALADKWASRLQAWRCEVTAELEGFQILSRFGETERTFVMSGWVPQADLERVQSSFAAAFDGRLLFLALPMSRDLEARAPVQLENIPPTKPFESLVKMMAVPRYNRSDPTFLTAIFLPVFFGLMLGDIGYGAIILLASLLLLRRWKGGFQRDLLRIIAVGAAWAVVFGFLFGELFGTLGEQVGLHPIWMGRDRQEDLTSLLLMTVALGAGHVTLGLVLGLRQAVKDRSRSHLLERGGMLVGLCGLFMLAGVLAGKLPPGFMTPGVAVMIVGIVLLSASLGWIGVLMGPIEFIGLIGNVLSYLRIAAIGLASVYLAKVANEMAGEFSSLVVGLVLAVLIHALNLVLGVFSPAIHSLRLHYVEFYRKFYDGGGRPYEPFQRSTKIQTIHTS